MLRRAFLQLSASLAAMAVLPEQSTSKEAHRTNMHVGSGRIAFIAPDGEYVEGTMQRVHLQYAGVVTPGGLRMFQGEARIDGVLLLYPPVDQLDRGRLIDVFDTLELDTSFMVFQQLRFINIRAIGPCADVTDDKGRKCLLLDYIDVGFEDIVMADRLPEANYDRSKWEGLPFPLNKDRLWPT